MASKRKIVIALVLVALLAVVGISARQERGGVETASRTERSEQKGTTSTSTHVVKDMMEREVELPKEIRSIGTFGAVGVLNGFVMLIGAGDRLANNLPPGFTRTGKWKYQYEFFPKLAEKPVFEDADRAILIETVLEHKPDVCLTMSKDSVDLLASKGLKVIYLKWDNVDDVKVCIDLLGEILGKEDVAKRYTEYFNEKVAKADEIVAKIPETARKKALYGIVNEFTQPHVIAEWWISKAGGKSVTDNGRASGRFTYTLEDLLKWNPDVIFVYDKKIIPELKSEERFRKLKAVQEDRLHVTPVVAHVWANRTIEQPLTIFWAMNKLYPDRFGYDELTKEVRGFYKEFFHYELSDEQIEEIVGK